MVRVALVNPPVRNDRNWVREGRCQQLDIWGAPFPPFSLAMVSRQLVNRGCETIIVDAGPESKNAGQVLQQLRDFCPDHIVMTTATPTIDSDLEWFLPQLRNEFKEVKIAAIGIHVTALPRETLERYKDLDLVVLGEPEAIVGDLFSKKIIDEELDHTLGIGFRKPDGVVQINEKRPLTEDLDEFGIPDWDKIEFSNYIMPIKGKPFSLVHFARGCPHRCSYCTAHTFNGRLFRRRSVGSLIAELEYNISLGVHDFLFWTELLTGDTKYLNSILEAIIDKGLHKKIRWVCNSRVDTVNLELLKKMKQAGCWQVAFGFDFGSNRMLKVTQKGGRASIRLAKEAAEMAAQAGLVVDGHFMLGYPGETEVEMKQTVDLALSMPLTFSHFYAVVPYPGSQLYTDWTRLKSEKNLPNPDWESFDQTKALIETEEITGEKIIWYKKNAYRRFYFRPGLALRILKIPNSWQEFLGLLRASLQTMRSLLFWS